MLQIWVFRFGAIPINKLLLLEPDVVTPMKTLIVNHGESVLNFTCGTEFQYKKTSFFFLPTDMEEGAAGRAALHGSVPVYYLLLYTRS